MLLAVELLLNNVHIPKGEFSAALDTFLTHAMENPALKFAAVVWIDGLVTDHALVPVTPYFLALMVGSPCI